MNVASLRKRAADLKSDVEAKVAEREAGRITGAEFKSYVDKAVAESGEIETALKALEQGGRFMANQDVALQSLATHDWLNGAPQMKALGSAPDEHPILKAVGVPRSHYIQRPETPLDLTREQCAAMYAALQSKTPFGVTVGQPTPIEKSWAADVQTKSTTLATESGIGGSFTGQLPAIQTLFAVGLGYEPTRASILFPGAQMPGPSATWLTHTSNTNPAAGTGEGEVKPNLGPQFSQNQVVPQKITGLLTTTLEAWQDTEMYGEAAFASWLPIEATRALIDAESNFVINANASGGPTSTFDGLLAASGTLSRSVGSNSPLDALRLSFVDLRTGAGFCDPDSILMHPESWAALQMEKDAEGRYVLDLLAGPATLDAWGQRIAKPAENVIPYSVIPQGAPLFVGNLWGVPVATSTHVPAGTAIVMSIKAGAGIWWQRLGLRLEFNMYGGDGTTNFWTQNAFGWRVEERVALSIPRPAAVNVVTGLPTA